MGKLKVIVGKKINRRLKAGGIKDASDRRWITEQILTIPELAVVDREDKIRISISCGRSTNYADEYWIENTEGKPIPPHKFGSGRFGVYIREVNGGKE